MASVGLAAAMPYHGPPKNLWLWFDKEVLKRIQITGTRTFAYHQHEVTGDKEAFETLNYFGYGNRKFTDIGSVSLAGRNVAGVINFQSSIINNRYSDPQAERTSIDYDRRPFTVNVGDIRGSLLNSNRFAIFNKFLEGAQARYRKGPLDVKGIVSESRGSAKTISFQGNNSAGPYYLQQTQIIRGSEEIQVDGQPMTLGRDYTISYESGSITFISRIIPPTSTIVVSFETLGYNSSPGKVTGLGMTYDFGRMGRVGLTHMSQSTGAGNSLSNRVELFQGSGAPSTPYYLQFEPLLTQPVLIKLDGIPQVQGVDFVFDTSNPTVFYFLRFISLNSTIEVIYTPKPNATVTGDREVLGFDYRIGFGPEKRRGSLAYYQATGEQKGPANPLKGTARGVDGSLQLGDWQLRGGLRKIPAEYVSIETRGLNRNEEAYDWGARYRGKKIELDMSNMNSMIALRQTAANGDTLFRRARAATFRSDLRYRPEVGVTWDLTHSRSASRNAGSETELNRTALTTGRTFGRLIVNAGVEDQQGHGPVTTSTGTSVQDVNLRSYILDATYTAGSAWAFRARTGLSDIKTDTRSGQGLDQLYSVTFTPSARFSASGSFAVSDSGALATLGGFDTGAGLGYGGNGFSGGLAGPGLGIGGTDYRVFQLLGRYLVTDRLSVTGSFSSGKSAGYVSSNSKSTSYASSVDWDLGKGHQLGLNLSQTTTKFSSLQSDTKSTTLDFDFSGNPKGNLSYHFGANVFSTGSTAFGQDSSYLDASLAYRIARRHVVSFSANRGRTSGYSPQDEDQFTLSYAYQIYKSIALVSSYRFRDVRNRTVGESIGAYRSKGLDIELTFSFFPG